MGEPRARNLEPRPGRGPRRARRLAAQRRRPTVLVGGHPGAAPGPGTLAGGAFPRGGTACSGDAPAAGRARAGAGGETLVAPEPPRLRLRPRRPGRARARASDDAAVAGRADGGGPSRRAQVRPPRTPTAGCLTGG